MYSIMGKKRINSRKFEKVIKEFKDEKEVLEYFKDKNILVSERPYIFTHLGLNTGEILVCVSDYHGIICSPEKMFDLLKEEGRA